jgi:hypothetical protein
LNECY